VSAKVSNPFAPACYAEYELQVKRYYTYAAAMCNRFTYRAAENDRCRSDKCFTVAPFHPKHANHTMSALPQTSRNGRFVSKADICHLLLPHADCYGFAQVTSFSMHKPDQTDRHGTRGARSKCMVREEDEIPKWPVSRIII
jgi:hypothetical protein